MKLNDFIATVGGSGYARVMPGTAGSVVALAPGLLLSWWLGSWFWIAVLVAIAVSVLSCQLYIRGRAEKDPKEVVIDELAGTWIVLAVTPWDFAWICVALFLFRLFDILKPPPLRQMERWPGGIGITADDVGAGLIAAALILLLQLLPV